MFKRPATLRSRALCEKFWAPFNQRTVGDDLARYGYASNLKALAPHGFSCSWNGHVGNKRVAEGFLRVLLAGFDVKEVDIGEDAHGKRFPGILQLAHTRRFLTWQPTGVEFTVPFEMKVESLDGDSITHVNFYCGLSEALGRVGCPPAVAEYVARTDSAQVLKTMHTFGAFLNFATTTSFPTLEPVAVHV